MCAMIVKPGLADDQGWGIEETLDSHPLKSLVRKFLFTVSELQTLWSAC